MTLTFDDTFVYSTTATVAGHRPRGITVVFFATAAPSGLDLGDQLKEHFKQVAIAEELWLVAPASLGADLTALAGSRQLQERVSRASALSTTRCVTFDATGRWTEVHHSAPSDLPIGAAQPSVQSAGLRALFAECKALLTAHAGLHFGKPSGKHSTHFLRGGAVAERSVHAHFVAAALLEWVGTLSFKRIWVDTAAISSIAYALNEMRQMLAGAPPAVVDSFSGYDGIDHVSFASEGLALISATTSGGLSSELVQRGVPVDRQRTLFFVGLPAADPTVLCDMTARGDDPASDLIPPFRTWDDASSCELCRNGQNVVVLQGDSFAPAPGLASPLQLTGALSDAAHRAFVRRFLGHEVISLRRSDEQGTATVRALSLHFRDLIQHDAATREEVTAKLQRFLPFQTRYLIHLEDPESSTIATLAKELCDARGLTDVEVVPASSLASRPNLSEGVSVVIAGVVATGRELLNVSRELRKLVAGGGDLAYFVGCARTSSMQALRDLRINLTFKADRTKYSFENVWYAQTEPSSPVTDPWRAEERVLSALDSWLGEHHSGDHVAAAGVAARRELLSETLGPFDGFVPSDLGAPTPSIRLRLNPNFALWDSDVDAASATHAEVYFTMSTVLHRSRHSADGRYSLFEQPGFGHVLAPTNFDRFNDPVIQAALLRAARGTELHFAELPEQSARMAEIIATAVSHWEDEERGGAALEFAFSLLRGITEGTNGAIRLHSDGYDVIRDAAVSVDADAAPILARTLEFVGQTHHQ